MGRRLEENGFLVFFCGRVVHAASENSPSGGNGLRQILTANEASGKWYFQQNKTSRKIKIFALLRRKWFPGMAHRWGIRPRTYPKTIKFRGEFFPVWYNGGFCVLWIFFFSPGPTLNIWGHGHKHDSCTNISRANIAGSVSFISYICSERSFVSEGLNANVPIKNFMLLKYIIRRWNSVRGGGWKLINVPGKGLQFRIYFLQWHAILVISLLF